MKIKEAIEEMRQVVEKQITEVVHELDNALVWVSTIADQNAESCLARVISACASLLQIVQNQQAQIEAQDETIKMLQANVPDLIEARSDPDSCQRCGHAINEHSLFYGCKLSSCRCSQFVRGLE
jgi:hypothetical protein